MLILKLSLALNFLQVLALKLKLDDFLKFEFFIEFLKIRLDFKFKRGFEWNLLFWNKI